MRGWEWGDHILKPIFRGSTQHVRLQDDFVKFIKIALTFSVFTFCAFSSLRGPACIASIFPGSSDIIRKRCVDSAHDPITLEIVYSNDVLRYNNNCRAAAPTLILTPPLKGRIGSGVVSISRGVTRRMVKAGSDCPFWREQDRRIIGLMQWLGWSG